MGGVIGSVLALVLLTAAPLQASSEGPARLVVDFSTEPRSSYPSQFASAGDVAFFVAEGPAFSRGLWATDGTASGTRVLKADGRAQAPVVLGRDDELAILFLVDNELWKSDATPVGTVRLARFASALSPLTVGGNNAYFAADDGIHGRELWRSDGSVEGTVLISDISPGSEWGIPAGVAAPLFVTDKVFFIAVDPATEANELALWASDGTAVGTRMIKGGFARDQLTFHPAFGALGSFYFAANHNDGRGLWRSDGTEAGTTFLAQTFLRFPAGGTGISESPQPFHLGSSVAFFSDGALWTSDGTAAGTSPIRTDLTVTGATLLGSQILFTACDQYRVECGIWQSDGTTAGTQLLADIDVNRTVSRPCSDFGTQQAAHFVTTPSRAYFWADGGPAGATLWYTDGSRAGTAPARGGFRFNGPGVPLGDSAVFAADDGLSGTELWKSDGTEFTTVMVRDLAPGTGGDVDQLARTGHRMFFTASKDCSPTLVSADMSSGQIETVLDGGAIRFETGGSGLQQWFLFGRFPTPWGFDSPSGIYSSDGTKEGTHLIRDADVGTTWRDRRGSYFALPDGLYALDRGGIAAHFLSPVAADDVVELAGNGILFIGGSALWSSEGTLESTRRLVSFEGKTFVPGSLKIVGKDVYLATSDATGESRTLWRTDGTKPGTVPVYSFSNDLPHDFASIGGDLVFTHKDALLGRELWRVRGDDVVLVRDVNPGPGDGADSLVVVGDQLYFVGNDSIHGHELWASDGTAEGTILIHDIFPGSGSGLLGPLAVINRRLVFAADDGKSGLEPWRSDGSENGTQQIQDIAPGVHGSNPSGFTAAGAQIYFAADDGLHGRELWQIPAAAIGGVCSGDCDGDFEVTVDEIVFTVTLALAGGEPATCAAADGGDDNRVTVDDVLLGVTNLLGGCSSS